MEYLKGEVAIKRIFIYKATSRHRPPYHPPILSPTYFTAHPLYCLPGATAHLLCRLPTLLFTTRYTIPGAIQCNTMQYLVTVIPLIGLPAIMQNIYLYCIKLVIY